MNNWPIPDRWPTPYNRVVCREINFWLLILETRRGIGWLSLESEMQIAKLNNGNIVKLLKHNSPVMFSEYLHSLVNDNIDARPQRYKPYWVISTSVVWVMDIGE